MEKLFLVINFCKKCAILRKDGQILIEILVALGIIVVVVSTVTIVTTMGLTNGEFSRNQNQATQYAQEGMELLRTIRDSQLDTFRSLDGTYCLSEGSTVLVASSTCTQNIANTFIRSVLIEKNNVSVCKGGTKGSVSVSWTDGKCSGNTFCHNTTVVSCFAIVNIVPGL